MTAPTFTHEPFTAGRGDYGWHYADNAVRHVEKHNCSKGCAVPTPKDIAEFGPGGTCGLLASLFTGDPIPEFEGTDTHVICHARQPAEPVPCPRYKRSRTGEVVHRFQCPRRGRTSVEWTYAEGMSAGWIAEQIARYPWLRACSYCRPDEPAPTNLAASAPDRAADVSSTTPPTRSDGEA